MSRYWHEDWLCWIQAAMSCWSKVLGHQLSLLCAFLLWFCLSWFGLRPLVELKGNLSASAYDTIIFTLNKARSRGTRSSPSLLWKNMSACTERWPQLHQHLWAWTARLSFAVPSNVSSFEVVMKMYVIIDMAFRAMENRREISIYACVSEWQSL